MTLIVTTAETCIHFSFPFNDEIPYVCVKTCSKVKQGELKCTVYCSLYISFNRRTTTLTRDIDKCIGFISVELQFHCLIVSLTFRN